MSHFQVVASTRPDLAPDLARRLLLSNSHSLKTLDLVSDSHCSPVQVIVEQGSLVIPVPGPPPVHLVHVLSVWAPSPLILLAPLTPDVPAPTPLLASFRLEVVVRRTDLVPDPIPRPHELLMSVALSHTHTAALHVHALLS
ncbi:hypothetical protein RSAG8_08169, partial [Rhizoctonia solani AG-8 WAC10335]